MGSIPFNPSVKVFNRVPSRREIPQNVLVADLSINRNKLQPDVGAFAEYVGACADLLVKLPDNMSFEEGASFGVGVATSIVGIFGELRVPVTLDQLRAVEKVPVSAADGRNGDFVLVAGGSTASGTRAIQLLRLYV